MTNSTDTLCPSSYYTPTSFYLALFIPTSTALLLIFLFVKQRFSSAQITWVLETKATKLERKLNDLRNWNKYLAENLKRQSMAVEDLTAMEEAMEKLKQDGKKDELKEVLIDSQEVIVKELLGKGGNGEVHIANYKGTDVALKRITQIDPESIQRFRFECFMMKDLRHPNIVRLIGVCWDDFMMAAAMEFVDNNTLEWWLRDEAKRKAQKQEGEGYEQAGPPSTFLRDQALKQGELDFAEAVFKGWTPPPEKDYAPEDLALIKRCESIILGAYNYCIKAYEDRRNSISITKASSASPISSPSSRSRKLSDSSTSEPLSRRSSKRRGSIVQSIIGLGGGAEIVPPSQHGGWVRAEAGANLENLQDSLADYNKDSAMSFRSFLKEGKEAEKGVWEALCYHEVNMRPDQFMMSQMHPKNEIVGGPTGVEWLGEKNEKGYLNHYRWLTKMKILSDREAVFKGVGGCIAKDTYITAVADADDSKFTSNKKRAHLKECGQLFMPIYNDHGEPHKTLVIRLNRVDLNLNTMINKIMKNAILMESARSIIIGPYEQKIYAEKQLATYQPKLEEGLTWKGQLFDIMSDCASVLNYMHQSRYFSEKSNKYMECIIHRDLKPENMLLTKSFDLKLADFGEARAGEEKKTMSVVGTPLYVAPEVLRNDKYDKSVDVYSFGMCLVACIRAEKNLSQFLLESLRKDMGRKTRFGIGAFMLNNKMLNKNWRPKLPRRFVRAYPGLNKLIKECWQNDASLRPDFDDICHRMHNEIRNEVMTEEEPNVLLISKEDDKLYGVRIARKSLDDIEKTFDQSFRKTVHDQGFAIEEGEEAEDSVGADSAQKDITPDSTQRKTPGGEKPVRLSGGLGRSSSFDANGVAEISYGGPDSPGKSYALPGVELAKMKNLLEKEREKVEMYESKLMEMGIKLGT